MEETRLVDISLGVVLLLVKLVSNGVLAGGETGSDGGVRVLGDLLVGLCERGRERTRGAGKMGQSGMWVGEGRA